MSMTIVPIITAVLYSLGIFIRPSLYLGFALQASYMAWRGITLGRLPLVGVHDTLSFLSASFIAFGLAFIFSIKQDSGQTAERDTRILSGAISLMAAIFAIVAAMQAPKSGYLPPVLNTYWFELHVALSFFSYALFGIAAVLGVLYLMRGNASYERLQYKAAFIGYALFSISMIFGGVWAHLAWGTYWIWTPKELWTSLLWIYYALYLHARLYTPMTGRPVAIMGIVGFGVVLFTYLGVSLLMKSSHSF